MKNERQKKILELIEKYEIDTQETLIAKLAEEGYKVTQTTVSRDIKELKIVKGTTGMGTYKYVSPRPNSDEITVPLASGISKSVTSVESAENSIVIKTYAGMANAVSVYLESFSHVHIVGTVAGDDTLLVVFKTREIAEKTEDEFKTLLGIR